MSFRAGFVGIVGLPNSGKSTFTNLLVGEKVSIISPKAQSTRCRSTGVLTNEKMQAIFVDAPGYVESETGLNAYLKEELLDVIAESDVLLVFLARDCKDKSSMGQLMELVKKSKKPWLFLVTKTDLSPGQKDFDQWVEELKDGAPFLSINLLKPAKGVVEKVKKEIYNLLPASPAPLYDPEVYTTKTLRELVAEIIREKCYQNLHQEIPYGLGVKILKFIEDEGPVVKIYSEIILSKENHKSIVVGRNASMIKKIGLEARSEIESLLGQKVFLDLYVTVKKNWQKKQSIMKELGYVTRER